MQQTLNCVHRGLVSSNRETVNGKPARYFRVNHAFKGVEVTVPGTYIVSFSYWPRYFTVSLWISGMGVALLSAWLVLAGLFSTRMPRDVPLRALG